MIPIEYIPVWRDRVYMLGELSLWKPFIYWLFDMAEQGAKQRKIWEDIANEVTKPEQVKQIAENVLKSYPKEPKARKPSQQQGMATISLT